MNRDFIAKYWYASIYEQQENQIHDVEFLLQTLRQQLGHTPQNILEVACGGGRICVPLAQAGHQVTGFDADEYMLARCYRRMQNLQNLRCYQADALQSDWGNGFDVVVMAGNILINIEHSTDYAQAQATFVRKAAGALRQGGYLYMAFDLYKEPAKFFNSLRVSSYFEGTDDMGTYGRTVGYGGVYDPVLQTAAGIGHVELTLNNGDTLIVPNRSYKHIPTQEQVYGWLTDAGFILEGAWADFTDNPLPNPIDDYHAAILWARKA